MRLKFVNEYKSVKPSTSDIEISDFAFFTGKNGSGKTHILLAIKEGQVSIENISKKQILYLNYLDFAHDFQTRTDYSHKVNAWSRLNSGGNDLVFILKNEEEPVNKFKSRIEEIAAQKDRPILDLKKEDFNSQEEDIAEAIQKYKFNIFEKISENNYLGDEIAQSVFDSVICKSKTFLSNITENDFKIIFQKTAIGNRKILSDLSSVFFEYYKNIKRNIINETEQKPFLSTNDFITKYGPPPWDLVRNIFVGLGVNFDVNDPVESEVDVLDGSFQISFKHTKKNNKIIPFDDLSSGEKILITLINAIYTANNKNGLPGLILLDEIDGPLNPSIIEKFISYLQDNFVKKGIKLIIATHSPTTIAFAPEDSVYQIDTNLDEPISRVSNKEGIMILSEGYTTLGDLLEFQKISTSKIIISEGKNYKFLEKAKAVFSRDNDLSILHIRNLGSGQLRILFEFMRIFNQEKQFIFVWDGDYRVDEKGVPKNLNDLIAATNRNNQVFIFEPNPDGVVKTGIENLINLGQCLDYTGSYQDDLTKPKNKEHFQNYLFAKNNDTIVFEKIKPLFDFISGTSVNHNL